ncbi:MAG: hypothetical protein AABX86_02430, partial [Nanoarchaeota archaeon]
MKKEIFLVLGIFVFSLVSLVLAQPNLTPTVVSVDKAAKSVTVVIPANAVEVADDVFSLGTVKVNGKVVEGFMIIDHVIGFTHKPNHNPPGGGGGGAGSTCFAFIAQGARWKTTELYVLNSTNSDGLSDAFVAEKINAGLENWDGQVAFDVFGARNITASVDGADTASPDNKNEIFFGNIDEPGAIAVTIVWGVFRGPPSGREIVEFDMVFDDPDFLWGNAGPTNEIGLGNTTVMDFWNIAAHEGGHAGGMGH